MSMWTMVPVLQNFVDFAGHAVVEAHAKGEQQVGARLELDHRLGLGFCGARIRR